MLLASHLAMFVMMCFLLFAAIITPHDQKHWAKVVLIVATLLVGWRMTTLHGAPEEIIDVACASLLLLFRRQVWHWLRVTFGRDSTPIAAQHERPCSWPEYRLNYPPHPKEF